MSPKTKPFYDKRHQLFSGKVLVYTRIDRPDMWYCRIKNPTKKNDYITRMCYTSILDDAIKFSENLYMKIHEATSRGVEVKGKGKTFSSAYAEYIKTNKQYLSHAQVDISEKVSRRYLLPYFGNMALTAIDDKVIEAFWEWRRSYWTSGPGVTDPQRCKAALEPKHITLLQERTILQKVLRWTKKQRWIDVVYDAKPQMLASQRSDTGKRPEFSEAEYNKLMDYMKVWVRSSKRPNHNGHIFHRNMIRGLIMFAFASGLRPNEMWQLRWSDIGEFTTKIDGKTVQFVTLRIAKTTKTGARTVVPHQSIREAIELLRSVAIDTAPDKIVFAGGYGGSPMKNANMTIAKLFKEAGVAYNRDGDKRTLYSCRHTYATERLLANVPMEDLARNMGTSVLMIEEHYSHVLNEQRALALTQGRGGEVGVTAFGNFHVPGRHQSSGGKKLVVPIGKRPVDMREKMDEELKAQIKLPVAEIIDFTAVSLLRLAGR